ncbi:hypothetical protein D623_10023189 [Myotis brandtii]|uniref:Uncharacterized protein n=1 Tax=Myotis brandtii TaxID=109478 RepID=S7N2B5_MYOBR|nr:hypothetical protein D623_10023189 [Myotis brandtii]
MVVWSLGPGKLAVIPDRPQLNCAMPTTGLPDCWPLSLLGRKGRYCNSPDLDREPHALPANQVSWGRQIDADKQCHPRPAEQQPSPETEARCTAQSDCCRVDQPRF